MYEKSFPSIRSTSKIYEIINESRLNANQKVQALIFIEWLLCESETENLINKYIPKSFMVKVFNNNYGAWFNKLKGLGVIDANNSYYRGIFCKSYKLNKNLNPFNIASIFPDNHIVNVFSIKFKHPKKGHIIEKPLSEIFKSQKEKKNVELETIKNLGLLNIDIEKLNIIKDNKVKVIKNKLIKEVDILEKNYTIRFFKLSEDGVYNFSKRYFLNKKRLTEKIESGYNFFSYKHKYYLTLYPNELLHFLRNQIDISYTLTINKIASGDFFARRNDTNNRLDSNITNLAGELTKQIMIDNNLVEFDLKNSQMAIMAHKYPQIDEAFISNAEAGTVYEYLITHLGLDNRSESKTMMFILMFSRNESFKEEKLELKELFPKLVDKAFEIKDGEHNKLAILLQQFESELFIDKILTKIYKNNLFALSKHDSIICKIEDSDRVKAIIQNEFDKIGFRGTLN